MDLSRHATERLSLRRVAESDLDVFVALESALRAVEDPPRDPPSVDESARYLTRFVEQWRRGPLGYWAIGYQQRVAGFGGVQPKTWRGRRCWNLYYRVWPQLWGLGIATETAREAIAVAGRVRPEWPVVAETDPSNAAAIRVAERAGLTMLPARDGDRYATLVLETATQQVFGNGRMGR